METTAIVPAMADPFLGEPSRSPRAYGSDTPCREDISTALREEVAAGYLMGNWRWTGCAWFTRFGPLGLNLEGLRSDQARLWSQACQGPESKAWAEAALFLDEVETDALAAEQAAGAAFGCAQDRQFEKALEFARQACALEARYREPITWVALLRALERCRNGE